MSAHTKGPWKVRIDPQDGRADMVSDDRAGIAAPFFAGRSTDEINANARLIAAAPDLLEALRAIMGEWEAERLEWHENRDDVLSLRKPQPNTGGELFDAARAAISKATGEEV